MLGTYEVDQELYRSESSVVGFLKGFPREGLYVSKSSARPYPDAKFINGLERECGFLKRSAQDITSSAVDLITTEDNCHLVMPYLGENLLQTVKSNDFSLDDKIDLAIKICEKLSNVHDAGIIHADINPENILVYGGEVFFIDFGFARELEGKGRRIKAQTPYGDLIYMSPERTGFLDLSIDHRSDIYSLGAVLYYVFTEQSPIRSYEHIDIIHEIVSGSIVRSLRVLDCPFVEQIVHRQMCKEPSKRYQSARGVLHDLCLYRDQKSEKGEVTDIRIGSGDIKLVLQDHTRLFGRAEEKGILQEWILQDTPQLCLVEGAAGVGKTTLIRHAFGLVTTTSSLTLSGKSDQYQQSVPFYGIKKSFSAWLQDIIDGPQEVRDFWVEKLNAQVGRHWEVLKEVIPELEWLVGDLSDPPALSTRATQERFKAAFNQLVQLLTSTFYPLILFLDDAQWLDPDSYQLILDLLSHPEINQLKVCLACRSDEVADDHRYYWLTSKIDHQTIPLSPLSKDDHHTLVQNCFHPALNDVVTLSDFLYLRTIGNPFYSLRLIKDLHAKDLIDYQTVNASWVFVHEKTEYYPVSRNLLQILEDEMSNIPKDQQTLLGMIACLGNPVASSDLERVVGKPIEDYQDALLGLTRMGYLRVQGREYNESARSAKSSLLSSRAKFTFGHDKIQEAAYHIISASHRTEIHLSYIASFTPASVRDEDLPTLLDHYTKVEDDLTFHQKSTYYHFLIRGAEYAAKSMQYAAAATYLKTALRLHESGVDVKEEEISTINATLGQFEALQYREESALTYFERAKSQSNSSQQLLSINKTMAALAERNLEMKSALEIGTKGVAHYGVRFPKNPFLRKIKARFLLLKTIMSLRISGDHKINRFSDDAELELLQAALLEIATYGYTQDANYFAIAICDIIGRSLDRGNTASSSIAYVALAMLHQFFIQDYRRQLKYGELARLIAENSGSQTIGAKIDFSYYAFIHHWHHPIVDSIGPLYDAHQKCIHSGELVFAGLALNFQYWKKFIAGYDLPDLARQAELLIKKLQFMRDRSSILPVQALYQSVILLHNGDGDLPYEDAYFDSALEGLDSRTHESRISFSRCFVHMFQFDLEKAWQELLNIESTLQNNMGYFELCLYYFFKVLCGHFLFEQTGNRLYLKGHRRLRSKLRRAEEYCATNVRHFNLMLEAVTADPGPKRQISQLFDDAIDEAKANKLYQYVGLYSEIALRLQLKNGDYHLFQKYLSNAIFAYEQWGASAVIQRLKGTFGLPSSHFNESKTEDLSPEVISISSITEATKVLSQNLKIEEFTRSLMDLVLKYSGANAGQLVILEGARPTYHVRSTVRTHQIETTLDSLVSTNDLSVNSAIRQVMTERQAIDSQTVERILNPDHKVPSWICSPIFFKDELVCVLYLENWQVQGAFTDESMRLIKIISGQIAVSMYNMMIVQHLEKKVQARTQEIEGQKNELEKQNAVIMAQAALKSELAEVQYELQQQKIKDLQQKSEIRSINARIDGEESERQKIAEDLHSSVASLLSGAKMMLERLQHDPPPAYDAQYAQCLDLIREAAESTRKISHNLTALTLWQLGLFAACTEYFQKMDPVGLEISFDYDKTLLLNNRSNELTLFRIIQELANNTLKHASARSFALSIKQEKEQLAVWAIDDGVGFEVEDLARKQNFGLTHIKSRIRYLGGDVEIKSREGAGCQICITLPLTHFLEASSTKIS